MKWSSILVLVFMLFQIIKIYGQQHYFNSIYNNNPAGSTTWSVLEHNSKYITCGLSVNPTSLNYEIIIIEVDSLGEMNMIKLYGDPLKNYWPGLSGSFKPIEDGFILAGSEENYMGYDAKFWRFDNSFDTIFTKNFESRDGNWIVFRNSCPTYDGGIIFCGQDEPINDSINIVLLKTDSWGDEKWRENYQFNAFNYAHNIIQTIDSGYLVGGYINKPGDHYSGDPYIFKTDNNGNILWEKNLGSDIEDGIAVVSENTNGDLFVGYTLGTYQGPPYPVPPPYMKIGIKKLDHEGNELWDRIYGASQQVNFIRKIIILDDNSIIAVGESYADTVYRTVKGWLLKVNNFGDSLWCRYYAYYNNQYCENYLHDVYHTSNNGFLLGGGAIKSTTPGEQEKIWVVKVDSNGCLEPGCDPTVQTEQLALQDKFEFKVFPNPASSTIIFSMPTFVSTQNTEIRIYNINGIIIENIALIPQKSSYQVNLSEKYYNGIYFVTLVIDNSIQASTKFIVQK